MQWCVLNLIPITCHDQQGSKTSVLAPTGHQPSWLVAQWVGKAMCWFSLPSCSMSICLCTYLLSDQALLLLCGILRFDYRPPSHAHLQSLYEKFIWTCWKDYRLEKSKQEGKFGQQTWLPPPYTEFITGVTAMGHNTWNITVRFLDILDMSLSSCGLTPRTKLFILHCRLSLAYYLFFDFTNKIMQDGQDGQDGQDWQDGQELWLKSKFEFPGCFCRAAFAILTMIFIGTNCIIRLRYWGFNCKTKN